MTVLESHLLLLLWKLLSYQNCYVLQQLNIFFHENSTRLLFLHLDVSQVTSASSYKLPGGTRMFSVSQGCFQCPTCIYKKYQTQESMDWDNISCLYTLKHTDLVTVAVLLYSMVSNKHFNGLIHLNSFAWIEFISTESQNGSSRENSGGNTGP